MSSAIRTTHVGSLPRPARLRDALAAGGEPRPELVADAVLESVQSQLAAGVDIVNDGEMGRPSYVTYVTDRLTGFGRAEPPPRRRDNGLDDFPEFAASRPPRRELPVCVGSVSYRGEAAVERDVATLRAALGGREGFLTAASPGVIEMFLADLHHGDREDYLSALAAAMKIEYDTVVAAGLTLQLDCPDLACSRTFFEPGAAGRDAYRRHIALNLEVLDHALRDVPPERVRMHVCWGNYAGPHNRDVPLADLIDLVLAARPATVSFEGANPRHGHEWELFEQVGLPAGKTIMPGVVDSTTPYVEHPRLVAQRIERYARAVGSGRVLAATDCGLATFAAADQALDPRIAYAKLRSLAEGADIAASRLHPQRVASGRREHDQDR